MVRGWYKSINFGKSTDPSTLGMSPVSPNWREKIVADGGRRRKLISRNVIIYLYVLESQLLHKIVNKLFAIKNEYIQLMVLWGGVTFQNHFINALCEIRKQEKA